MARFKKPYKKKKEGKIVYGDGIVNTIVTLAIAEIPNVKLFSGNARGKDYSKAITVKFDNQDVFVDVAVKINYLQSVSDMAFKIQEVVRHNVEAMTEYHISGVNVDVRGVMFEDKVVVAPVEKAEEAKEEVAPKKTSTTKATTKSSQSKTTTAKPKTTSTAPKAKTTNTARKSSK